MVHPCALACTASPQMADANCAFAQPILCHMEFNKLIMLKRHQKWKKKELHLFMHLSFPNQKIYANVVCLCSFFSV